MNFLELALLDYAVYLVAGALTGVLSGMLGVGGGLLVVPVLLMIFNHQHLPTQSLMQLAIGSSLATIMFTGAASAHAHHRHGNIDWQTARQMTPAIALGAIAGAGLSAHMQSDVLRTIYLIFLVCVATQLMFRPTPLHRGSPPGKAGIWGASMAIGALSSLVGVGGGTLSVPFLVHCGNPIRRAIGTSAFLGLPIALAATASYILLGWNASGRPPYSLGLVYLPAVAAIATSSVLCAPLGVSLAHRTPVGLLRKLFALILYALAARIMWSSL